jgi:Ni/Co efflux regulator RcnB
MTIKTKFAGALFAALTIAAPLALSATSADAAPMKPIQMARNDHDNNSGRDNNSRDNNGRGHVDAFHDRNHRPPMKVEYRPRQPHGHYRWRAGAWNWSQNQWAWQPGIWIRF